MSEALRARFGDRFSESAAVREHHGRDESPYPVMAPDGVVFAHSTEEVAEIARLCNEHRVPLIPYGAGSSLEGHILAIQGGISLDLSQMNKVLAVNAEDLTATVQAGVLRKQLNERSAAPGCSSPSIRAPTPAWAAWPPRAPPAPTPCATAPCARTSCR